MKTNDPIKLIKEYIKEAEKKKLFGEIVLIFENGELGRIKETRSYRITK